MEDAPLSAAPSRFFQFRATVAIGLYTLSCGLNYGWNSSWLVKITAENSEVNITSDQDFWLTMSYLFGNIIGGCFASVIVRNFGRKTASFITATLFVLSWSLLAFSTSFSLLVAARVLSGIPDALMNCTLPSYLGEVSDPKIRGALFCCASFGESFGYLLINIFRTYLSIRTAVLTVTAVPIAAHLIFLLLPESPYYLISKGRFEQAKSSLKVLKGSASVDKEFDHIRKAIEDVQDAGRYVDVFRVRSNRSALLIICGVTTVKQLSGHMAINFYAQTIFEKLQSDVPASTWSSMYFLLQTTFLVVNALLVDPVGRKPLMIISTLGNFITLSTLSVAICLYSIYIINEEMFTIFSLVSIIGCVIIFNLGLPPMSMLLLGEMFPTNIKSYAISTHELYFYVTNVLATKLFYFTKENYGIHVSFLMYAVSSLLGSFFIMFVVPETKQKSLEEIQDMLKN